MLKLYRNTAETLLLLAAYSRARGNPSMEDVLGTTRNIVCSTKADSLVLATARKSIKFPDAGSHWLDATLKTLYAGLADEQNGTGEADLVDQIVRACQLPYTRNVLSGESMRRLRAAILLPSEQAGLSQRLRQREMSCSQCGIALHDRESVTLVVTGDGQQAIACHRCVAPTSVPCASCEQVASLSTKAMNAMSRMQCPSCQEAKAVKKHPGESAGSVIDLPMPIQPAPAGISRFATQGGRNARTAEPRVVTNTWQAFQNDLLQDGATGLRGAEPEVIPTPVERGEGL